MKHKLNNSELQAFTLLEILIVLVIMGILLVLSCGAVGRSKAMARQVLCATRLKQWGMGFNLYAADHEGRLPDDGPFTGSADTGWPNVVPPYLDAPRYKDIPGYGKSITNFNGWSLWSCPARESVRAWKPGQPYYVCYAMNRLLDDVEGDDGEGVAMECLKEPDKTVMLFDTCTDNLVRDYTGFALGKTNLSHKAGANVLMADGQVRYVRKEEVLDDKGRWITNAPGLHWYPEWITN